MFRDTRVHVVIPAYNVASHLDAVLRGVPDFVDTVTVVDDASTDDTAEVAKGVGDPRVTVLGSPVNEGVGGAMVRGFEHALALGDGVVVKMDGDG
jgi:dolichol-phosphate mannosyltransferase